LCPVRVFIRTGLILFALFGPLGCKRPTPSPSSDASVAAVAAPTATITKLREPTPAVADLAHEAPALEAKLTADKGYVALWEATGAKHRALFLTVVGELLAEDGAPKIANDTLRKRGQFEAAKTLHMYHGRVGRYPEAFTKRVESELARQRDAPHRGLWSPPTAGQAPHDWTALAMWLHNDDPAIVRERFLAKRHGPLPWVQHKDAPSRPWLVERGPILTRLQEISGVTPEVCEAANLLPATKISNDGKEQNTCNAPPKPTVTLADNEWVTKPGYVIALTEAQLETAVALVAADDKAAFDKYVNTTPGVSITTGNDVVTIADTSGFLASKVRIRKKGNPTAYWTVREAIERP
jgi:hypothetical protein